MKLGSKERWERLPPKTRTLINGGLKTAYWLQLIGTPIAVGFGRGVIGEIGSYSLLANIIVPGAVRAGRIAKNFFSKSSTR